MENNNYFNKPIHSVTKEDLQTFFAADKVESDRLEFKSYVQYPGEQKIVGSDKERVNAVIKTLCAFLNSDGGTLVWGAPEGVKGADGKEKIYRGALSPVKIRFEQDQFTNKITDEISPAPMKILFKPIEINPGEYCYVFEVARSDFAPHQFKGAYYMRIDGSTRPAPHHYVEALIKRITFPRLHGSIKFGDVINLTRNCVVPFVLSIHNLSKTIQEKELKYTLICSHADIIEADLGQIPPLLNNCRIDKNAKSLLHSYIPYTHNYLLVVNDPQIGTTVRLIFNVRGERSPALISTFDLVFKRNQINYDFFFDLHVIEENIYMMDREVNTVTEHQTIDNVNLKLIKDLERKLHNSNILKILDPGY